MVNNFSNVPPNKLGDSSREISQNYICITFDSPKVVGWHFMISVSKWLITMANKFPSKWPQSMAYKYL